MEEKEEKEEKQTEDVLICNALAEEIDEIWSYYHDKSRQVWLWRAVEHTANTPLAYVFGTREHKYLEELLKLVEPFSPGTVYANNSFADSSKIPDHHLVTGKKNTQRIERDHLTLRTRIKRLTHKTVCFSKDKEIHMAVICSMQPKPFTLTVDKIGGGRQCLTSKLGPWRKRLLRPLINLP